MPATVARDQGKSTFIKQALFENPYANSALINEAWTESGREGSISTTLVNKMRSELGLTGNLRGRGGKAAPAAAPDGKLAYAGKKRGRKPKSASIASPNTTEAASVAPFRGRNARVNRLVDLEADIDRLLFKAMSIDGLADVEDALRQARRLVYRAIG